MRNKINVWKPMSIKHIEQQEETPKEEQKEIIKKNIFQPKRIQMPNFSRIEDEQNIPIETPIEEDPQSTIEQEDEFSEARDFLNELRSKRGPIKRYLPSHQRRGRFCISISVSEEDEVIFRAAAMKENMSLSAWARDAMYKSAKVKQSHRDKK